MNKNIELLAPAGNMEALKSAVENGANAVYLGGKLFSARQYASNFNDKELEDAVKYAHIRGVRVYVALNILLSDDEIDEAIDYLVYLYSIDVDAVIVQDLAVIKILRELLPDFEMHGSTQMTINNSYGARLLEEWGLTRVVLARELSSENIKYIHDNAKIGLEAFIHGALCISYSGQCLMSSIIGGRSGNRGRCAQPCRMPYSLVDLDTQNIVDTEMEEKYILSPKDLNTIEDLEQIIESGVESLKVEGRMKRSEYVSIIVNKYRNALNGVKVSEKDKKDMAQIFNRGFTKGYISGDRGSTFISLDRPNNRGIEIGNVTKQVGNKTYIYLKDKLVVGDGIRIIDNTGQELGLTINKIYIKEKSVDSGEKGDTVYIKGLKNGSIGAKVMKTSDITLLKESKKQYIYNSFTNVHMAVKIYIGRPVILYLWDDNGNYIEVKSEILVEEAKKVATSKERVEKQLSKLGNTSYNLKSIEIDMDKGANIPIKLLNSLRRQAIDKLNSIRVNFNNRKLLKKDRIEKYKCELKDIKIDKANSKRKISVMIDNRENFERLDMNKFDRIYINFIEGLNDVIDTLNDNGKEIILSTDRIIGDGDFDSIKKVFNNVDLKKVYGVSASNLGTIKFIKENFDTNIHCDIGINIFNSVSAKFLEQYGISSITLSPELTLNQIKYITKRTDIPCDIIVYGYLPVMTMKHCPFSLIRNCKNDNRCYSCEFREGFGLRDRKGEIFPVKRNSGITTVYNGQTLMLLQYIDKIYDSGISCIRLDFNFQEPISEIQKIYYDFSNNKIDINEVNKFVENFKRDRSITKGHLYRGVL